MKRDHLDSVTVSQILIQSVAVVRPVAYQSFGEEVEEALPKDSLDQLAFVRRSAFHTNAQRKGLVPAATGPEPTARA